MHAITINNLAFDFMAKKVAEIQKKRLLNIKLCSAGKVI